MTPDDRMTSTSPAANTHQVDIQVRFSDTDALGHVNNVSLVAYAETGRLGFAAILGDAARSLILAHLSIDFRRQVVFGERVSVDTRVERVGTTSVTLQQIIRAGGEVAAEVKSVVVSFDYAAQRPKPWSPEATAALSQYVHH